MTPRRAYSAAFVIIATTGCSGASPTSPLGLAGPSSSTLAPASISGAEVTISSVTPTPGSTLPADASLIITLYGSFNVGLPDATFTLDLYDQTGKPILTDSRPFPTGQAAAFALQAATIAIPPGTTAIDLKVSLSGTTVLDLKPAYRVH